MPRFYFNVYNHLTVHDEEGHELPSMDAAMMEARNAAAELISDDIKSGRLVNLEHRIEVSDAQQRTVHVLRFGDLVLQRSPQKEEAD